MIVVWLLVPLLAVVLVWFGRRAWWRRSYVRGRRDAHDAMAYAVEEWITEPKIREAILSQRVASQDGLQALRSRLGRLTEPQLRATVAGLMSSRVVRRFVARHIERHYDTGHKETMRELFKLALSEGPAEKERKTA